MKGLYSFLYAFIFMGIGVLSPLVGLHLGQMGFTGRQIGIITAAGTCTVIFASPFWGSRYTLIRDRRRRYLLVALVLTCAALTSLVLWQIHTFAAFLPVFIVLYFFQSPSSSLLDAMTIDEGQQFGHIRTFGALGFALSCFLAAQAAGVWGTGMIFPIYAVCFLGAAATVAVIRARSRRREEQRQAGAGGRTIEDAVEDVEEEAEEELRRQTDRLKMRAAWQELAGNRSYLLILASAFFVNGTDIANNTYFSFLYLEGGGALAGVGLAFLLMAGSEAPFMAASAGLCRRFGQGRVLLVAMVFSLVRFGLFALGLPAPLLIALFPLQGLVNGITLVEFVRFIAAAVPDRLRGLGIAVYYAFCNSVSTILCQLIGGRLLDCGILSLSGPRAVYLFFALFNGVGLVIFLASRLHRTR